jgi:hypothetical protein
MHNTELIKKLSPYKYNKIVDKLLMILDLCEFQRIQFDSIDDLLNDDEIRCLIEFTRGVYKDKRKTLLKEQEEKLCNLLDALCKI